MVTLGISIIQRVNIFNGIFIYLEKKYYQHIINDVFFLSL